MRRLLAGLPAGLLLMLTFTVACAGHPDGPGPASSGPLSMFSDIPVAPELSLDEKDSRVYDHQVGQVGLLRAAGPLKQAELVDFYRAFMPANGWMPYGEFELDAATRLMVFGKPPRSAAVIIKEGWVNSQVEINVSAKR